MTTEQRTLISPEDIIGVEYSCPHCGGKHLTPIKGFVRVLLRCPNCNELLVNTAHPDGSKPNDELRVRNFIDGLDGLKEAAVNIKLAIANVPVVPASGGKD